MTAQQKAFSVTPLGLRMVEFSLKVIITPIINFRRYKPLSI